MSFKCDMKNTYEVNCIKSFSHQRGMRSYAIFFLFALAHSSLSKCMGMEEEIPVHPVEQMLN